MLGASRPFRVRRAGPLHYSRAFLIITRLFEPLLAVCSLAPAHRGVVRLLQQVRGDLPRHQVSVDAVLANQLVVGSDLGNAPVLENSNCVCILWGAGR